MRRSPLLGLMKGDYKQRRQRYLMAENFNRSSPIQQLYLQRKVFVVSLITEPQDYIYIFFEVASEYHQR